jgi:hypothetical protein
MISYDSFCIPPVFFTSPMALYFAPFVAVGVPYAPSASLKGRPMGLFRDPHGPKRSTYYIHRFFSFFLGQISTFGDVYGSLRSPRVRVIGRGVLPGSGLYHVENCPMCGTIDCVA